MDMKKILQAIDTASTKPVEGASDMSRFLSIVAEGYLGGFNTAYLEQIVISNQPKNGITPQQALAELKKRVGSMDPYTEPPSDDFIKRYLTRKLEEADIIQPGLGNTGILDANDIANIQDPNAFEWRAVRNQIIDAKSKNIAPEEIAKLQAKYDQLSGGKAAEWEKTYQKVQAQKQADAKAGYNKNVRYVTEGANPHKVALPVQMAMQHYQKPQAPVERKTRIIDKYFTEAEAAITQRKEERRAAINQYASVIAERVLMKEAVQLDEKSKTEKQARFMAAAAHDTNFANRVGIKQSVAKEFNKADTGTKKLSQAMKHKPKKKGFSETMAGVGLQPIEELSTELLGRYKKAAYADARKADAEGDYARGDKRFKGINKATNKQFANDLKKHNQKELDESMDRLLALRDQIEEAIKQRLDPKCWKGKHKEGTKIKGGVRVNNCVPNKK